MAIFNRKSFLLAATVATVLGLGACASVPAPTHLADTVARKPELSTLNRLLQQSGLSDTLRTGSTLTVFAPSDEAFKAVPAKTMAELSANPELLKSVLTYHVLPTQLAAAQVKNGSLKTVQGANLALATAGTFVTVEDAVVTQADVGATNGVLHVIDKVLIPPKR